MKTIKTPTGYVLVDEMDNKIKAKEWLYDEINNDSEKLFIQLQKFPKFVSNIKITPAKADYLIRLK